MSYVTRMEKSYFCEFFESSLVCCARHWSEHLKSFRIKEVGPTLAMKPLSTLYKIVRRTHKFALGAPRCARHMMLRMVCCCRYARRTFCVRGAALFRKSSFHFSSSSIPCAVSISFSLALTSIFAHFKLRFWLETWRFFQIWVRGVFIYTWLHVFFFSLLLFFQTFE